MSLRFSLRTVRANSKPVRATMMGVRVRPRWFTDTDTGTDTHTQAHTHNLLFSCFVIPKHRSRHQGCGGDTQRCTEISECHGTEIKEISVHQGAGARVLPLQCCPCTLFSSARCTPSPDKEVGRAPGLRALLHDAAAARLEAIEEILQLAMMMMPFNCSYRNKNGPGGQAQPRNGLRRPA